MDVVPTGWLAERLHDPTVVPVDASWYLPGEGRDARAEYETAHIPGAVFWDLDALSAPGPLPHMMPDRGWLAQQVGLLGIGQETTAVVYDGSGINLSAPRVWWMLRTLGHTQVAVLDGGLGVWRGEGRPVEAGQVRRQPVTFELRSGPRAFVSREEVVRALAAGTQVLDARSAGRFEGTEPEPREGMRGGHIPGSRNLHYRELVQADGTLRSNAELRELFTASGIAPDHPVITTCGSGVSACALILALEHLGFRGHAVYDGSWAEWGGRSDTPVATGPPG